MSETERQFADHAAHTVQKAQYLRSDVALRELSELRDNIGSGANVENERAAAWLAIGALCKMLNESPRDPNMPERWQRAIDKTATWLQATGQPG